jgi:fibronectin-binding autotransporter adhesin
MGGNAMFRFPRRRGRVLAAVALVSVGICPLRANAAVRTWINTSGGAYETPTNWTGGVVPTSSDSALFNQSFFYIVTLSAPRSVGSLTVGNDNFTFNLGAATYSIVGAAQTALTLGQSASDVAQMTVQNGTLASSGASVGHGSNSTGVLTFTTGGFGTFSGNLQVGNSGNGTLNIQNGADVAAAQCFIASTPGTVGNLFIDGTGSTFATTTASGCAVGSIGSGTVTLQAGGTASSANVVVGGSAASSAGTVSIGFNSSWNVTSNFTLGNVGAGTLIMNSGTLTTGASSVGAVAGAVGFATLGFAGGWTCTGGLTVGNSGTGTIRLNDGGTLSAQSINVARFASGRGAIIANGASASVNCSQGMFIGSNGDGTFALSGSARATVGGGAVIGGSATAL